MRMKFVCTFILFVISVSAFAQAPVDNRQRTVIFEGVNVVSMDGSGKILENQQVVVSNGKITHIGKTRIKVKDDPLVINAKGKYLIPGLAEMHAHVPPVNNLEPMKEVLLLYAFNGITTIRGMLGHERHLELRDKIAKGEILGPRLYTSGPSINGQSVQTPGVGAFMAKEQKEKGYDLLKLHPGLTIEKFDAVAKAAKEAGIPFAGHVSYDVGVWRAIEAGYSSIDHLDGFIEGLVPGIENISEQEAGIFGLFVAKQADTARIPKLMKALHNNKVWVVPTQSLAERWFSPDENAETLRTAPEMKYMSAQTLTQWVNSKKGFANHPKFNAGEVNQFIRLRRQLIKACQDHEVGLLLGSDAPQIFNVPGFAAHHELKYMVDAGLTPYQALQSGTSNVGRYFNREDIGIIRVGAVSDLVLLNGNPLADINNTKKIEGVMLAHNWLSKEYIEQELKKLEKS